MLRTLSFLVLALSMLHLGAPSAWAQTDPDGDDDFLGADDPASDDVAGPDGAIDDEVPPSDDASVELSDEQALTEERVGTEVVRDSTDPFEEPLEGYYFLGIMYRHWIVPSFLLHLFVDEAVTGSNPGVGVQFTYRKNNFDIIGSLWWMGGYAEGAFRGPGDPVSDTEWIDSGLSALWASATFLWSTPIDDAGIFAFEYGIGVGVGVVFGDLVRTEAYPLPGNDGFAPCEGVGMAPQNPAEAGFCEGPSVGDGETGGHYNVVARKWTDGGSVPNVMAWLEIPHLALRIKPIKQLMMRIEAGLGLGFYAGASAAYGF
jgi:hypothetical protein